jgi:hypothetical protein
MQEIIRAGSVQLCMVLLPRSCISLHTGLLLRNRARPGSDGQESPYYPIYSTAQAWHASMDQATFMAAVHSNLGPDWASLALFSKSGGMPSLIKLHALASSPAFQLSQCATGSPRAHHARLRGLIVSPGIFPGHPNLNDRFTRRTRTRMTGPARNPLDPASGHLARGLGER